MSGRQASHSSADARYAVTRERTNRRRATCIPQTHTEMSQSSQHTDTVQSGVTSQYLEVSGLEGIKAAQLALELRARLIQRLLVLVLLALSLQSPSAGQLSVREEMERRWRGAGRYLVGLVLGLQSFPVATHAQFLVVGRGGGRVGRQTRLHVQQLLAGFDRLLLTHTRANAHTNRALSSLVHDAANHRQRAAKRARAGKFEWWQWRRTLVEATKRVLSVSMSSSWKHSRSAY